MQFDTCLDCNFVKCVCIIFLLYKRLFYMSNNYFATLPEPERSQYLNKLKVDRRHVPSVILRLTQWMIAYSDLSAYLSESLQAKSCL